MATIERTARPRDGATPAQPDRSTEESRSTDPPRRHPDARVIAAIPAYNEELAIGSVVVKARRYADQVVVVDDGSNDDTAEVAADAGAEVLRVGDNRGKGHAVRLAFMHAMVEDADAVVLLDGDGQHDPDEIPQLVDAVLGLNGFKHPVDVALGFRFGDRTEMPLYRRVGKRILDYATATAAGGGKDALTDSQCGFRAFGRKAIQTMAEGLTDDGFTVESEQIMVAREKGLRTVNVPISARYEGIDGSTHGPIKHAVGVLNGIVEKATRRRPLLYLGLPSILLMVAGGGWAVHVLFWWRTMGYFSLPQALGAATFMLIGMLGIMAALMLNMMALLERRLKSDDLADAKR